MSTPANLVAEETTTTGTGDLTLAPIAVGLQPFSDAYSTGTTFTYFISHQRDTQYEIGEGELVDSTTLRRNTVYESTNGGNLVDLSAGPKDVVSEIRVENIRRVEDVREESSFDFSGTTFPTTITHGLGEKYVDTVKFFDSTDEPFDVTWRPVDSNNIEVSTNYNSTGTYVIKA